MMRYLPSGDTSEGQARRDERRAATVAGLRRTAASHRLLKSVAGFFCAFAFATTSAAVPLRAGLPMLIEADTFEIDMTTRKATWTGNVIATQAGHEIRTEHFTITLAQQRDNDGADGGTNDDGASTARNAVIIEAGHLGYHHDGRELTSSGGTVIKRGESRIEAHTLIYRFEQQLAVAAPDESGRVHVVLTMAEDAPIQLASTNTTPLSGAQ